MIRILFIGDVVGKPGRELVAERLARLRTEQKLDLVIANGENAAHGAGINGGIARGLLAAGVDVVTLGDHVWDQKGWEAEIDDLPRVCRPANLPGGCPGADHVVVTVRGFRLAVFTVLGRTFMGMKAECPFHCADGMLRRLAGQADGFFVEAHMEATSEKIALGWHLDGRAAAVVGTHTHVPTADATVLPEGTAYLTDAGMTGPYESVLGRDRHAIVARFLDGMPRKCEVAEGDARLCGAIIDYDEEARRARRIEPLQLRRGR